jgi:hypothetical protein
MQLDYLNDPCLEGSPLMASTPINPPFTPRLVPGFLLHIGLAHQGDPDFVVNHGLVKHMIIQLMHRNPTERSAHLGRAASNQSVLSANGTFLAIPNIFLSFQRSGRREAMVRPLLIMSRTDAVEILPDRECHHFSETFKDLYAEAMVRRASVA